MTKKSKQTLPKVIKDSLEKALGQPVTSTRFEGEMATEDGGYIVYVPTFTVNNTYYVYVHNNNDTYCFETIAKRKLRQEKFGRAVHELMDEYGLPWKAAKCIYNAVSNNRMRLNFCDLLKEVKEDISFGACGWKKEFYIQPNKTMSRVISWYELDYWIDFDNPGTKELFMNYLFAR